MIIPTVGRKVWYRASKFDTLGPGAMSVLAEVDGTPKPLDATVLAVWNDRLVNVLVFDVYGKPFTKTSIKLIQEGDETPKTPDNSEAYGFVEWMPYQNTQAAKHAADPK